MCIHLKSSMCHNKSNHLYCLAGRVQLIYRLGWDLPWWIHLFKWAWHSFILLYIITFCVNEIHLSDVGGNICSQCWHLLLTVALLRHHLHFFEDLLLLCHIQTSFILLAVPSTFLHMLDEYHLHFVLTDLLLAGHSQAWQGRHRWFWHAWHAVYGMYFTFTTWHKLPS